MFYALNKKIFKIFVSETLASVYFFEIILIKTRNFYVSQKLEQFPIGFLKKSEEIFFEYFPLLHSLIFLNLISSSD